MDSKYIPYGVQVANEAVFCGLPGRENGPADAYRHMLWAAELARNYGYVIAKSITTMHEIDVVNLNFSTGTTTQSAQERAMDIQTKEANLKNQLL